MPQSLPIFTNIPDHRYTAPLDGAQFEFRYVWRARLGAWRVSIHDANGVALLTSRRLSPQTNVFEGVVGAPPGVLTVSAADPYDRHEIELLYYTAAEIAALGVA